MSRLVAVLGYSDGSGTGLHPICAARLARAESEAQADDVVLFSGWARRRLPTAEADLMASSWTAPTRAKLVDRSARTTLGNAIGIGRATRKLGVDEVVLVTSPGHGRRAALLVRASLRGSGASVRVVAADAADVPSGVRELAAWAIAPLLAVVAIRAARG
jgi:uncharacterized SAM-binding protein YcdF (DUF218 family)